MEKFYHTIHITKLLFAYQDKNELKEIESIPNSRGTKREFSSTDKIQPIELTKSRKKDGT